MRDMEASERHQPTVHRRASVGARSPRKIRLIDPGAIDYYSAPGLTRLQLMVGTVFDRLTAADVASDSDA